MKFFIIKDKIIKKKVFDFWLLVKYFLIELEKILLNLIKVIVIIYFIKVCNGVKIYVFFKVNCNIFYKNLDKVFFLIFYWKYIIKIGIIENEMFMFIVIFIEGKRLIKKVNVVKIVILILVCKGNVLFMFFIFVFELFILNGLYRSK